MECRKSTGRLERTGTVKEIFGRSEKEMSPYSWTTGQKNNGQPSLDKVVRLPLEKERMLKVRSRLGKSRDNPLITRHILVSQPPDHYNYPYGLTREKSSFVAFNILLIIFTSLACKYNNFVNGCWLYIQSRKCCNIFGFDQSFKTCWKCADTNRLSFKIGR